MESLWKDFLTGDGYATTFVVMYMIVFIKTLWTIKRFYGPKIYRDFSTLHNSFRI